MNVGLLMTDDLGRSPAERAALSVADGWMPPMLKLLRRAIGLPLAFGRADTLVRDGASLLRELDRTWLRFARGTNEAVVLGFAGPIVSHVESRVPFHRVGDLALSSLTIHWQNHFGAALRPVTTEGEIAELRRSFSSQKLVCSTFDLTAPAPGQLILAAQPETWL
jgi:hypothetical protein